MQQSREFRGAWSGKLVCEDLSGYKALFDRAVTEIGFMAHAIPRQLRLQRSKPIAEALRQCLTRQRGQVPDGSATAKAIEYSLG